MQCQRRVKWMGTGLAAGLAVGLSLGSRVHAEPPVPDTPQVKPIVDEASVLMQAKLSSSKNLLEGLLKRDFDSIARTARELKRISKATAWPRERDAVYEHFATEFQRQCSELESQADRLDHQGIKFTYLGMTTTCINCHDYIRDSRRVADLTHPRNVRPIPSRWPVEQGSPRHE